jgi:23S rRNA pseudoU1915 N3-methylase RlmH
VRLAGHTIYSVQKSPAKIVKKYAKKLLTQAFSRHIIGVASEQKKCTEAKNEQKQKFEQKLHKNDRSSQAVVLFVPSRCQ